MAPPPSPPVRVAVLAIALDDLANRIVELKAIELRPELAAKLAERGGAWMADQVSQAIEHAASGQTRRPRRCPA